MKNKILTITFCILLAVLTVGNIAAPKKDFSENENRELKEFPEFSFSALKDGSFTADFSEYLADHFLFRDVWVSLKSLCEQAAAKNENNGIYNAADGYLITHFSDDKTENFRKNSDAVAEFERLCAENYSVAVRTLIAPTATEILSDKLPPFALNADPEPLFTYAEATIPGFIDLTETLTAHKDEYIFYRTDHHWTDLGAYYAYCAYTQAKGAQAPPRESYNTEILSEEFFGTSYSKYGFFNAKGADTISAPSKNSTGVISFTQTGNTYPGIYFPENLEKKDKYTYFLNGNEPLAVIETKNAGGTLLLIKDSYANSFIPYLSGDYKTIVVVDLRYYSYSLYPLIQQYNVTEALVLYNLHSFADDSYLPLLPLE